MTTPARRRTKLRATALVALGLVACAGAPQTVSLRVSASMADAMVTVDDELLGTVAYVSKKGVALPPGRHRLSVEKAGYFPFDRLVEAPEGAAPIKIEVTLEKIPD